MEKQVSGMQTSRMTAEEAEEFMALLLAAQKGDHNCPYADYFRKIGQRMMGTYFQPKSQ